MVQTRSQRRPTEPSSSVQMAPTRKRRAASPPTTSYNDGTRGLVIAQTPRKAKKKVRFSDPGPDISSSDTTGITPFISRTSLTCGTETPAPTVPRLLARPPRRRTSMPEMSNLHDLGTASRPIEIHQFMPLRQALTPRTQRQLKRNHLSEEMNDIESDKRTVGKLKNEIQKLKDDLELATQLGARPSLVEQDMNAGRIRELEEELGELKRETSSSTDHEIPMMIDDDDSVVLVGDCSSPALTAFDDATIPHTSSPSLRTVSTAATSPTPQSPTMVSSAGVQTTISSQSLDTLYAFAQNQTKQLGRARIELERLLPSDKALELTASTDVKVLTDTIFSHISTTNAKLDKCKSSLAASQAQYSNLHGNFNITLKQLEEARAAHAKLIAEGQQGKDATMAKANERIDRLQGELKNYIDTHGRLTAALDKYREDVRSLESLVEGLEIEHAGSMAKLRAEKDEDFARATEEIKEEIADLTCMVAAETRGRREAESAIDEMDLKAKEAKNRENEVREALNEKQSIVRELETSLEGMKQIWAQEVGGLNTRVGQLCSEVESKKEDLKSAEVEIRKLVDCVAAEKEASHKSLWNMKLQIERCNQDADRIGTEYEQGVQARSEQVVSALGLLTPSVEGGRFRDVNMGSESLAGDIEMRRGKAAKRKVDSGIGLLLEDDDED